MSEGSYREVTGLAVGLGIAIGIVLTASITYAGLVLGFTIVGSEIAAIAGWGILRGCLRRGTILENNIVQTVASGVNASSAGVIFTIPVLHLRGIDFDPIPVVVAATAGAVLGVAFIIPLRKQMIDIERLRFPSGTAVATILRSPGSGVAKARLLAAGVGASALVHLLVSLRILPESVDLGAWLGMPPWLENVWALSLLSVGAGFISGRPGLAVLGGGVLAHWILTPAAVAAGWVPAGEDVARFVHGEMSRPIGIGMLVGGALAGLVAAFPAMREALRTLHEARSGTEELPVGVLYAGAVAAFAVLLVTTRVAAGLDTGPAFALSLFGTTWLWLAGVIVAQCTGMTDWSPVSGLALVAVTVGLLLVGAEGGPRPVLAAVLVGVAVCVAISQCADMMQDLKTGHLVGARPASQQIVQLAVAGIGPVIAVLVVGIVWEAYGFGPEALRKPGAPAITAPQAQALNAAVDGVLGGDAPFAKYAAGATLGAGLSLTGVHGLGVLTGLSMYLPLLYVLPYGLGCVLGVLAHHRRGALWVEERGVPAAAGLIVGEAVVGTGFALAAVFGGV